MTENEGSGLVKVRATESHEYYAVEEEVTEFRNSLLTEYGMDSMTAFPTPPREYSVVRTRCRDGAVYNAVMWGDANDYPSLVKDYIARNIIAQRCQDFNVTACYGQGLRYIDRKTGKDTKKEEIRDFALATSLHEQYMLHATNMKYFYWSALLLTLNRKGDAVVSVQTLDVTYCRITDPQDRERYVIYGDWQRMGATDFQAFPLLDDIDPLGDLRVRMGKSVDPRTGLVRSNIAKERRYAMVTRMPSPGYVVYPDISYVAMFRDAWEDIYRLIGIGKRQMIKNTSAPRIQIEVHKDYWGNHCNEKGILEKEARIAEIKRHKRELKDFVCGIQNVGKALITGYYVDPNGKEQRMVRVINLTDSKKEGGDWSEDMQEAANVICFAFGVHPNLVGATPGKSQMNNSGSDKRELFTLKQAMEKPWHDIMAKPYHVIAHYNGWKDITVDVPMITLTTLDKNKDAKVTTMTNDENNSGKYNDKN